MDLLYRIDVWLIRRLEAFCHLTQRMLGATSVTWERLFLLVAAAFILLVEFPGDQRIIVKVFDGLIAGNQIIRFLSTYRLSRQGPFSNSRKITERTYRIVYALLSSAFVIEDVLKIHSFWFEAVALSMYFGACNDLPPAESRNWSRVFASLRTQQVEA